MRRKLMASAVAGPALACVMLAACGHDDSTNTSGSPTIGLPRSDDDSARKSWSRVSGKVHGKNSRLVVAYAAPLTTSDDGFALALVFSSDPQFCDSPLKFEGVQEHVVVALLGKKFEPQSFQVVAGEPTGHGVAGVAMARVGADGRMERYDGAGGRVTLNVIHGTTYEGFMEVRLSSGETIAGKFRAPTCEKLDPLEV
jgi:hypothetical protein